MEGVTRRGCNCYRESGSWLHWVGKLPGFRNWLVPQILEPRVSAFCSEIATAVKPTALGASLALDYSYLDLNNMENQAAPQSTFVCF